MGQIVCTMVSWLQYAHLIQKLIAGADEPGEGELLNPRRMIVSGGPHECNKSAVLFVIYTHE